MQANLLKGVSIGWKKIEIHVHYLFNGKVYFSTSTISSR